MYGDTIELNVQMETNIDPLPKCLQLVIHRIKSIKHLFLDFFYIFI